ncbi:acyl-CoA dehydrogenase family protein [Mycolicibacterium sp. CBMA 226]|uniref:acyl-CoA dehydrogenase family protein n=1 Tax=Mycolicibacterium sp. CBMA 226 TaxID=2606611 RepID=UPI0012DE0FC0|nr:acyl-CoA dehydrogenase family protein [Mycolicibacterium sp. CBMA 226]MUL78686.1 acyl-CoA dehydrogenase [Mycolicibacterium sp. CBMA 226]
MTSWNTAERRELRQLVGDFTDRRITPFMGDWESAGEVPRELHRQAGELGLLGLGFPERAGGAGDFLDFLILNEEIILHGGSAGLCGALLTHAIATPHIADAGNPNQIECYVRPTLEGASIGALAVTEPGGGSDVASLRTKAVRDGDSYIVNGAKTYITSGCRADFVTTAVRTGDHPHKGVSLLVIDTDSPGFVVTRKLDKMGCRCSDTAELSFTDVRVPVANLVGPEGTGFGQIMQRFDSERLVLSVQACATAQRCVDLATSWARDRVTFGQPLVGRQVIRHRLAEMARQVTAAQSFVRDVAVRYTSGERVTTEVAMAKNTATFACEFVVHQAVQIFGGMGYMRESEVERHYRDSRIMGIGGGATEIMNEIIAKGMNLC